MICPKLSKVVSETYQNKYIADRTRHFLFEVECLKEKCAFWKKETTQDQNLDLPEVTVVPEKMAHLEKGAQLGKLKEPKESKEEKPSILDGILINYTISEHCGLII